MDNFRVSRQPIRPRLSQLQTRQHMQQTVDGFNRAGATTQTLLQNNQNTLSNPAVSSPAPVVAAPAPEIPVQTAAPVIQMPAVPNYEGQPEAQVPAETVDQAAIEPAQTADIPEQAPRSSQPAPFDLNAIADEPKKKNRLTAGRAFRVWLLRGGLITMAILIAAGSFLFMHGYNKAHKVFRGDTKVTALSASAATLLQGEKSGRVNFLLLGNGGGTHDAPDLTDTMIVASYDTVKKTAVMFSIPRDLWVQVPGAGSMKINAAYEIGKYNKLGKIDNSNANTAAVFAGFKEVDDVVTNITGLTINYNLLVNFNAFKQAVDSVGGVTVNVPEQLYDPSIAWENGNNPVIAAAGEQQMNGAKALLYVRSRHTSSDFARSERQRSIMLALKDKVLTAGTLSNPVKLSQLISAFGDNMVTDMSLSEAMRAYTLTKGVSNSKIVSADFVTKPNDLITTGMLGNSSIGMPRAGLNNYDAIKQYVQQLLVPPTAAKTTSSTATPAAAPAATPKPETAAISVLNGTTKAGLASAKAAVIKAASYNVVATANAPSQTYAKTVIIDYSNGANPTTKAYLEKTFGTTATTVAPAGVVRGTADFVVILGAEQW